MPKNNEIKVTCIGYLPCNEARNGCPRIRPMQVFTFKENYQALKIKPHETYEWLLKKHYAKRIPSISHAFGLFQGNVLIGVLTIGKPASPSLCKGICGSEYEKYVFELNRLCIEDNHPRNLLSFFVASCLRQIKEDMILVSYADKAMGHVGYIYQATNWLYTGETKERTDIGFEDGTHSRHYDKKIDKKKHRKYRSSKHRYVYFIGEKKNLFRKSLRYPILPYPKGQNQKYDASYKPVTQLLLI